MQLKDLLVAGIYGIATADALGQATQYQTVTTPVIDMTASSNGLPAGAWSDDTSLTLATLAGLLNPGNQDRLTSTMNNFVAWLNEGAFTSTGTAFDIGQGTRDAILRYQTTGDLFTAGSASVDNNGNGALMRMLPLAIWAAYHGGKNPLANDEILTTVIYFAQLTHRHPRSVVACLAYVALVARVIDQQSLLAALPASIKDVSDAILDNHALASELATYEALLTPAFYQQPKSQLKTSGYVVDTLQTCWWLLANETDYASLVTTAINLGGDTDTIASIAGGVMALQTGVDDIPIHWREKLLNRSLIDHLLATPTTNF